jgi:transposase
MSQPAMRKYPAAFKERAVKLAVESDQPIAQTARDLGVDENTWHTWIGKYHRTERQEKEVHDEHLYDEVKRRRKENVRLQEERDILRRRRTLRNSCRKVRLDSPAASRVSRESFMPDARGLTQWLLRVASPPAQHPSCCSAVAGESATLFYAGTRHLRHTPPQASLGTGGPASESSPHRARAGPGRSALQNAAAIQSAQDHRAGTDSGAKPAQSRVHCVSTR